MKKSNKKIPKTHLPKYTYGTKTKTKTTTLSNGNEVSMYDAGPSGNDGTSNLYNEKRGINQTSDAQYIAAAGALIQGGANMGNVYGDSNSTNRQKADSFDQTARATTSAINPVIGTAIGVGDMIGDPIRADLEKTDPVTGEVKNRQNVKTGAAIGMFFDPGKWIGHIANGGLNDLSGNKYVDDIEANAQKDIAANKLAQEEQAKQQAAYTQQQNNYNLMYNDYQKRNGSQGGGMYAMGGMNMQPNAEIEKQENVVAPNGGFLQANGPSHEQGGVPVALPGNSMIFSDRLKLGKKTFAELNKTNNTTKEDRVLESNRYGNTSKHTAELMKFAKNKNSEALFNAQESLKQAKVEAYAKKMGVTLPQTQAAPEEGMQYPMGGKLPMYPLGGPTDNTKFTPAQRNQAYSDSLTLYNSGFNKNIPNWQAEPGFNDAVLRLNKLNGTPPTSTDKSPIASDLKYLENRSVPYAKPTKPVYEVNTDKKNALAPTYPNYNIPMKGLERPDDFNPQLKQVPANSPNTIKTNIVTTPNYSYKEYKQGNETLDRMYFNPGTRKEIELNDFTTKKEGVPGFKYGGRKLPKYEFGKLTPEEEGEDIEAVWKNSSNKIDAQHGWDTTDETTRPGYKNQTDWQGIATNIGMGLANNAGNIYNLSRYNKPEVEAYERMKATYLDPSAALRDAEAQTRRAEYNVRGASGGNAGTYLSNRVALNAQNTINKARIHTDYQNANAGISNSVGQYNNELARQEVIANAQNRARNRSGKGEAIGSMGSNVANQMMDNKKGNMDQETLQLMMKYYNDPQFKKYLEESGFNKKKTSK